MRTYKVTMDLKKFCWNTSREVQRSVNIIAESKGEAIRKALRESGFSLDCQSYCEAVENRSGDSLFYWNG